MVKIDPIIFFDLFFIVFIIIVLCLIAILIYERLTKNKGLVKETINNIDQFKEKK